MRISDFIPKTPSGPPIRVLIFYDEVGWAWWHRAGQIRKNVSPDILVTIQKIDEPFNHHDFDLFLLFDAQLLAHIAHVPREKIILGSSCPMLTPEAMAILKHERCAAGLLNSLGAYEEFRQEGKIYCCQNGVDTQLFQPPTRAVEPWVACWVGNSKSIGNKGLDLIREACRIADVRLLVVDKAELGQAAALMTQEEVRDRIYHQASFYICASESEGTPNPMLEAMACGLPAVSTRVGNAPELIRAGYNGFLAERNVAGLVQAIFRLKACNFADLSRQARQSILDGWTWRQQALKYQTAFRELASENRAHPGNPKTAYRSILWVDGAPPQGPWDPVSVIKALQAKYPDAAISICCEHSTEARYQGCDGIRTLIPFDRSRAGADSAYRMGILQRLQALDVDLAFNGSCRSDLVVDLLVLGSTRMERVSCRPFLARHNAALQAELTPLYTRLFATDPLLEGTGRQVLDMLAKAGVSGAPQAADSSAFDIRPAAAQPSVPDWNSRPAPPRILMVVHMFPPYWFAGVEVYTYHLAQSLRAQGVDVSVFYPIIDQKKAVPEILKSTYGGVPVFTLVHNGTGADFFNIEHPVIDRLFGELLDREDFQIVHFQHTICLSFRLPEIARSRGKRLCLTLHDFWMMCQRVHFYIEPEHKMCSGPDSADKCARCLQGSAWTGLSQLDRERTESLVNRRVAHSKQCMEMMDVVVSPSRYLADKFAAYGFSPARGMEVCPLGLKPVTRLNDGAARASGPIRFGFLGTIHPLKNVHLLADAFSKVSGAASLSFYGMGKQEHIDSLSADVLRDPRMRYAGKYGPDDLSRILSGLDMVIVSSITENYPLVVREALSAGVPVLASRVGGIPEIVDDGRTGMLFNPERPEELITCIQSLVDNPGRITAFKAAIKPVKTMDEEAGEWLSRYNRIIGNRNADRTLPVGKPASGS